jgi:hypothetical protein
MCALVTELTALRGFSSQGSLVTDASNVATQDNLENVRLSERLL